MSDKNIKKIVIKNSDLPDILAKDEGYLVRYRVVSQDKNRLSHWSPIKLIIPDYTFDAGTIRHTSSGQVSTFVWDSVSIKKNDNLVRQAHEFDIWVRFDRNDSGDWIYKQRVDGNSYSLPHPSEYKIDGVVQASAPNRVSIEIYLRGTPITRSYSFLKVYTLLNETI